MKKIVIITMCLLLLSSFTYAADREATLPVTLQGKILAMVNHMAEGMPDKLRDIDPALNRIALYRIKVDPRVFNPNLHQILEGKILRVFNELGTPKIVVLPKLNGLKIQSTDSTFSVQNTVPSMAELWKTGKRLGVQAFLEGEASYFPNQGLVLNLRLVKTGVSEVLWSKEFSVFEKELEPVKETNPMSFGLTLGMETYFVNIVENDFSKEFVARKFNGQLTYHTIDFGMFQYFSGRSRFRYEVRLGLAFVANEVKLNNTSFSENTFYGNAKIEKGIPLPVSVRFNTLFYMGVVEKQEKFNGDWLAAYLSIARHFTQKSPDFNCFGVGLRSDFSRNFSISAGISFVMSSEFDSVPLAGQSDVLKMDFSGIQYHLCMIQYVF